MQRGLIFFNTISIKKFDLNRLILKAHSDVCEKRMRIMRTIVSGEWRNSHELEKFPTAANYASEPG